MTKKDQQDTFATELNKFALDVFSVELESAEDDPLHGVSFAYIGDKVRAIELSNLFLEDSELAKLFPGVKKIDSVESFYNASSLIVSTDSSGTRQLCSVIPGIVQYAFLLMRLAGEVNLEEVPHYVARALAETRSLAQGEWIDSTCLFGLRGLTARSRVTGEGWGLHPGKDLRLERAFAEEVDVDDTVVCQIKVRSRVLQVIPWAPHPTADDDLYERPASKHLDARRAAQSAMDDEIDRARLAILLASINTGEVYSPSLLGHGVVNPLEPRAPFVFAGEHTQDRIEGPISLDGAALDSSFVLAKKLPTALQLGAHRLLRAVSERENVIDKFVDAVICWENMVGNGNGDTTLRVCGGLSYLIEPNSVERRMALYDKTKRLYSLRSKIVHGASEPTWSYAKESAEEAVDIALLALGAILADERLYSVTTATRSANLLLGRHEN